MKVIKAGKVEAIKLMLERGMLTLEPCVCADCPHLNFITDCYDPCEQPSLTLDDCIAVAKKQRQNTILRLLQTEAARITMEEEEEEVEVNRMIEEMAKQKALRSKDVSTISSRPHIWHAMPCLCHTGHATSHIRQFPQASRQPPAQAAISPLQSIASRWCCHYVGSAGQ